MPNDVKKCPETPVKPKSQNEDRNKQAPEPSNDTATHGIDAVRRALAGESTVNRALNLR